MTTLNYFGDLISSIFYYIFPKKESRYDEDSDDKYDERNWFAK